MNDYKFLKSIPVFLFFMTITAFLCFFLFIIGEESAVVYQSESMLGYHVFSDLNMEVENVDSTPAGIQKVYHGTLPSRLSQEDYLCFYISHHNIQIYFDDELVYSLTNSENNKIAQNVGSNWCIVHIGQTHAGKELTVILTPLFEAATSKVPSFLLGTPYTIAGELVLGELPLLVLSSLCILIGFFVVSVFMYFHFIRKEDNKGIIYLGLFSISIGLWKLTDLSCMSLLFPELSVSFGYISVGSLFLTSICLLAYFSTLFITGKQKILTTLTCGGVLICLTVLFMQIFGISEIRQNLIYSHILLIIALISVPVAAIINRIVYKTFGLHKSWRLLLLLLISIAIDLTFYYKNNQNGLISFSIIGLIIYILIIFLMSFQKTTRKAYTDSRTGLINRARWIEMMNQKTAFAKPFAILMVDINGLKHVNDTLGHEAGDKIIFALSRILRTTLPRNAVICRWGGDEFTVLLRDINRVQLDLEIEKLFLEGKEYNEEYPELPVYFAVGAVLSSEHPELSRQELFQLADEKMYHNKKKWYENQQIVYHRLYTSLEV